MCASALPRTLDLVAPFPSPSLDAWRELAQRDAGDVSLDKKLTSRLYEGIDVKPLYTQGDLRRTASDVSGFSGLEPYTRGATPLGNALGGWDIRQEHTYPEATTLNQFLLDDLEHGVTSVLLRFDAAGREGLDADDARAEPLVGVDGCSLSGVDELSLALKGVHLNMIHVSLEAGAAFVPAAALLSSVWARTGVLAAEARGAFNADPIAALARHGHLAGGLNAAMSSLADLAVWTHATYPHVTSVRVGTAAYHHAGATATQDLAFSMATALDYLRAMTSAGMSIDAAAGQVLFSHVVGSAFFLAIAKLRAARRLWARVVRAAGGNAEAARMRMHTRPSRRIMTTRDPWINMLRNTACVFAAGIGGADAIGSMPFDVTLGEPSTRGRRLARNTQLILQEESQLHRVCDPAGGSWYLESLTDSLAHSAWGLLQQIESRGGMIACLRDGWVKEQIDKAAEPRLKNLSTRRDAVLGVSEFANVAEPIPETPAVDMKAARLSARQRVSDRRASAVTLSPPVSRLSAWAADAAAQGATLGQIWSAMPHTEATFISSPLTLHTFGEAFERLRNASDAYLEQCGARPRVFVASIGPIAKHLARTNFTKHFFEAGGFDVAASDGYPTVDAAVQALRESDCRIAVIASDDATYERLVPALAPALHAAGARTVVLAGNPGVNDRVYRDAGVDRFIFIKCDVVRTLSELLTEEGVTL